MSDDLEKAIDELVRSGEQGAAAFVAAMKEITKDFDVRSREVVLVSAYMSGSISTAEYQAKVWRSVAPFSWQRGWAELKYLAEIIRIWYFRKVRGQPHFKG